MLGRAWEATRLVLDQTLEEGQIVLGASYGSAPPGRGETLRGWLSLSACLKQRKKIPRVLLAHFPSILGMMDTTKRFCALRLAVNSMNNTAERRR